MNLITEKQVKLVHVLLQKVCNKDKTQLDEFKSKIKTHYKVPSTWQLTSEQASQVIDRLVELSEQNKQIKLADL